MGILSAEPELDDILAALQSRRSSEIRTFIDHKHKAQSALLSDPSRLKAALCTRRAGKSWGAGLALIDAAYKNPNCNCLYLALTRMSAETIMWKDVLKRIDRQHGLNAKFHDTKLTMTLPNGAVIKLAGADAKPEEMEKFLGTAYKVVVIDECASFHQDLRKMVYSTLKPATMDADGTIIMIGTPGNITRGLFFDVTNGREGGWKVFRWSAADNPYLVNQKTGKHRYFEELEEIRKHRPREMETPAFKQMYLGQWVIDDSLLVYKFEAGRNTYTELPPGEYEYVLGVDLGFNDATAFVVCAYSRHDKNLYVVHTSSQSGLDFTATAERIKKLHDLFPIDVTVVDGANKQGVEEMRRRHDLPLKTADKRGKEDFIRLMNAELTMGHIKLQVDDARGLRDEWERLVWDEKRLPLKHVEHPNCANHKADAALYAWRHCYQYLSVAPDPEPELDSNDYWQAEADRMEALAIAEWEAEQEPSEGISEPDW